jgi:hypothetical protein
LSLPYLQPYFGLGNSLQTAQSGGWDYEDDFSSYATQGAADAVWIPNDSAKARVNITNDNIDFNFDGDGTADQIYADPLGGTVNDTAFILRYTISVTSLAQGLGSYSTFGMASAANMAGNTTSDYLGNRINLHPSVSGANIHHSAFDFETTADGSDPASSQFATPATSTVFPYELIRKTSTTFEHNRYTDDNTDYVTETNSQEDTCLSSIVNLRYMTLSNYVPSSTGSLVGVFDLFKIANGVTEAP